MESHDSVPLFVSVKSAWLHLQVVVLGMPGIRALCRLPMADLRNSCVTTKHPNGYRVALWHNHSGEFRVGWGWGVWEEKRKLGLFKWRQPCSIGQWYRGGGWRVSSLHAQLMRAWGNATDCVCFPIYISDKQLNIIVYVGLGLIIDVDLWGESPAFTCGRSDCIVLFLHTLQCSALIKVLYMRS